MTQSPLERYQQQLQMKQQQKKPDKTGFAILAGSAVVLIIVGVAVKVHSSRRQRVATPTAPSQDESDLDVDLARKQALYYDYTVYVGFNGDPDHSCKIVSDNSGLSIAEVKRIVREGQRKGWPTSSKD